MKNMTNIEVLKLILKKEESIKSVALVEFNSYNLIQDRIDINGELNDTFKNALKLREKYNMPFWDGFNLNLFNKDINDFDFFNQILFHNNSQNTIIYSRKDFIDNIATDFSVYTGFSSKVITKNGSKHIPLLDFHIPVNTSNQKICENVIKYLELTGYLLDSGKSFHFIGDSLVNLTTLKKILYKSLLLAPIIDRAWVAHQLIQNYCCLRVSPKYNRLPLVVSKIITN